LKRWALCFIRTSEQIAEDSCFSQANQLFIHNRDYHRMLLSNPERQWRACIPAEGLFAPSIFPSRPEALGLAVLLFPAW
jgi:hypothetical protein